VSFIKKAAGATAAVAVLAVAPALAATQRAQKSSSATTSTSQSAGEAALTGATLTSASDAAIAAVPGGKVTRASNETDGSNSKAAYEVHVTKSDGSRVVVIEDSSFNVLSTQADRHGGPGNGRGNGETPLTGTALTSASDAAIAAVPGGKVTRASKETDSSNSKAAYEVHVTKSDGSRVVVIEDSSFAVLSTQADQGPGPGGRGGPHGAPGG
jgi:hypothetical protein